MLKHEAFIEVDILLHPYIPVLKSKALRVRGKRIKIFKDEPDNRILECAISGEADFLVTGDKKMLQLREHKGVKIISLKEYLEF